MSNIRTNDTYVLIRGTRAMFYFWHPQAIVSPLPEKNGISWDFIQGTTYKKRKIVDGHLDHNNNDPIFGGK